MSVRGVAVQWGRWMSTHLAHPPANVTSGESPGPRTTRNYSLVFGAFAVAALGSWWNSHRVRLPDQDPLPVRTSGVRLRLAEFAAVTSASSTHRTRGSG
jgi:hypothetical protein